MSRDDWRTPTKTLDWVKEFTGNFTLDGAADETNAVAEQFCSTENSFFDTTKESMLNEVVWLNPPYSLARHFAIHFARNVSQGCMLLPVRPDRKWFQWLLHLQVVKPVWVTGGIHFDEWGKGAFMYSIFFFKGKELIHGNRLPDHVDASLLNNDGKGGATS